MAKTLTQQHAELVELHGAKVNELAAAVAEITALKAAAVESDANAAALAAQVKAYGDESARLSAELAAVTTERDALKASVDPVNAENAKLKATLAMTDIPALAGAKPDEDAGARTSDVTWEDAMKLCGSYAAARTKYPEAYREMMNRKAKK